MFLILCHLNNFTGSSPHKYGKRGKKGIIPTKYPLTFLILLIIEQYIFSFVKYNMN